jgi:purine-binding chemotaxis protein CheW
VTTTEILSTFHVGDFYCGIHTKEVIELTKDLEVTPVPLAPPSILGLLNLRGQIVTAIDMRVRLSCERKEISSDSIGIFYKHSGSFFSFIVDRVNEIIELDEKDFEPPPSNLTGPALNFVAGVYKMPGRLLLVLDPQKLITGISTE